MQTEIPSVLQTAAQTLCDSLRASEPFLRYEKARSLLKAEPKARGLLDRLSEAQAGVRQRQANGGVTQSDIQTPAGASEQGAG